MGGPHLGVAVDSCPLQALASIVVARIGVTGCMLCSPQNCWACIHGGKQAQTIKVQRIKVVIVVVLSCCRNINIRYNIIQPDKRMNFFEERMLLIWLALLKIEANSCVLFLPWHTNSRRT